MYILKLWFQYMPNPLNCFDLILLFSCKFDCFFHWLANLFYPSVAGKIEFPIIIFMDGHTSHVNLAVAEFCRDHQIILYRLPAHASHILQPLDYAVFGPVKNLGTNHWIDTKKTSIKWWPNPVSFRYSTDAGRRPPKKKMQLRAFQALVCFPSTLIRWIIASASRKTQLKNTKSK